MKAFLQVIGFLLLLGIAAVVFGYMYLNEVGV